MFIISYNEHYNFTSSHISSIMNVKDEPYLKTQIITYMGNKRKIIHCINDVINEIKKELNCDRLTIGDGFSGSGIVSRLFTYHASELYVNDLAGYSETLNKCYLSAPSKKEIKIIEAAIKKANKYVDDQMNQTAGIPTELSYISKYWSPSEDDGFKGLHSNERAFFTTENGRRIDYYMNFINTIEPQIKHYLLAPLIVSCSIHNNTNGQFGAFYKDKDGDVGMYGGKNGVDFKRITQPITIEFPVLNTNPLTSKVIIDKLDTNSWIKNIKQKLLQSKKQPLDIVYYDPPYNKHSYHTYYFLLDIINNWNINEHIPDTYRGQPKNWVKSHYNSSTYAKKTFTDLLENTYAKYIIISYNNCGIIPLNELDKILDQFGEVMKIPIEHKTYNRLKGLSSYKRTGEYKDVKEFIWVIKTKFN